MDFTEIQMYNTRETRKTSKNRVYGFTIINTQKGSFCMDERIKIFAHNLIHKSIQVKPGDKVYIDYTGESTEDLARQ